MSYWQRRYNQHICLIRTSVHGMFDKILFPDISLSSLYVSCLGTRWPKLVTVSYAQQTSDTH